MPYITFKDSPGRKYKCSMRLVRICKDNRLNKVSDLARLTRRELLSLPECGKTTAQVVQDILIENGLGHRI